MAATNSAVSADSSGTPELTTIVVTPAIANLSSSEVQTFSATGFDQYGDSIAGTFTWSVTGGGTIDNQGLFSAASIGGPFTVTAQSGAITGTASVAISDFPGNQWQTATPDSQGVDAAVLNSAMNYFDANARGVGSDEMVIVRNGRIIWQGAQTDAFHSIASGTKVFTTTVLGLLVQDGTIPSVDSHAVDFLPSLDDVYPDYAAMTFKQMASFTSGYAADITPTPDMIWGDATEFLIPISPSAYPGTRWEYSDPTSFQLGNLIEIASNDTITNIFTTRIADIIGMTNWEWRHYGLSDDGRGQDIVAYFTNPSGIYGGGIAATPLDIARFGLLFLNRGRWAGQQLLASSWVDAATTNQVPTSLSTNSTFDLRGRYGFGWLTNGIAADGNRPWPSAPHKTYTFYGGARNFCFVVPEWNMVIARMSPADQSDMPFNTIWDGFFSRLKNGISDTPVQQAPQEVIGFTLIDADTNSVIGPLENGAVIDIGMYPRINIRANTFPAVVGSVRFDADGNAGFHTTSTAPYYLMGDDTGNSSAWSPSIGSHVITATPYTSTGATGTEGQQLSVSFSVTGTIGDPILSGTGDAWQTVVLSFDGPPSAEDSDNPNPFLDYRMQVAFTGPSGQTYDMPGYFDGNGNGDGSGNVWKVRFVPDEEGTWSFLASFHQGPSVAISNDPGDGISASFDGKSGTFTVSPRDPSAPGFLSKGRLVYGDNYYLKTLGDGLYWIKGGTDEPENFLAYQGFDATTGRPDYPEWLHDYDAHVQHWSTGDPDWGTQDGRGIVGAINYLASKQVNSIYLLLMNIGGDGQDVWPYAGTIDRAGAAANDNRHFDISKLHQWDAVFEHAQKKGINLNLVLSEGEAANKQELDNAGLGTERKLFYREMIARFSNHNALQWMLCEEYDHDDLPVAPAMIKSWAQYIRDVDPYDHPVSVHNMAQDAWDPFFGDPRFDTTSYQFSELGSDYRIKTQSLRDQATAAGRPIAIAIDEPVTATTTDDEVHVIIDHGGWQQHAFGQSFIRKDVIYPIYFSGGSVELILQTGLSTDDFSQYDKLWDYMFFARKLLEELPFWEMEPSDNLLSGESSSYSGGQVFSKNGETYAIYLPSATPSGSLNLSGITGDFQKRWYNPRTGLFEGVETVVAGGSIISLGTPPYDPSEDWVVLLEKVVP